MWLPCNCCPRGFKLCYLLEKSLEELFLKNGCLKTKPSLKTRGRNSGTCKCIQNKKMHVLEDYSRVPSKWSYFKKTTFEGLNTHLFFWKLKGIREICKCSLCKRRPSGARLNGKLNTTKGFRSIHGAFFRSGRTPFKAWNRKFHCGWTIFPFQAMGWCTTLKDF